MPTNDQRLVYLQSGLPGRSECVRYVEDPKKGKVKKKLCDNKVKTSHYTAWNFVPKNLLEQFSKASNAYFLFIFVLQVIPEVSVTNSVPTIGVPLTTVVLINAIKDAIEDKKRHSSDRLENDQHTSVLKVCAPSTKKTRRVRLRHEDGSPSRRMSRRVDGGVSFSPQGEDRRESVQDPDHMTLEPRTKVELDATNKTKNFDSAFRTSQRILDQQANNEANLTAQDLQQLRNQAAQRVAAALIKRPASARTSFALDLENTPPPPVPVTPRTAPGGGAGGIAIENIAEGLGLGAGLGLDLVDPEDEEVEEPVVQPERISVGELAQLKEYLLRKRWRDVQVGDVVVLFAGQVVPADCCVLSTSDEKGGVYIETSSLDGETNLKVKQSVAAVHKVVRVGFDQVSASTTEDGIERDIDERRRVFPEGPITTAFKRLARLDICVECREPIADLRTFSGSLRLKRGDMPQEEWKLTADDVAKNDQGEDGMREILITSDQLLLRGCKVCHTPWVLALVLYTGAETKIILNSATISRKTSRVEKRTHRLVLAIFALMAVMCIAYGATTAYFQSSMRWRSFKYLGFERYNPGRFELPMRELTKAEIAWMGLRSTLTWIILFVNFVPISLVVSMGLVKAIQGWHMSIDHSMFDPKTNTYTAVRASDLNEELGQISYIMTDKTGTLTSNVMQFRRAAIDGELYGDPDTVQPVKTALTRQSTKSATRAFSGDNQMKNPLPGVRIIQRPSHVLPALLNIGSKAGSPPTVPPRDTAVTPTRVQPETASRPPLPGAERASQGAPAREPRRQPSIEARDPGGGPSALDPAGGKTKDLYRSDTVLERGGDRSAEFGASEVGAGRAAVENAAGETATDEGSEVAVLTGPILKRVPSALHSAPPPSNYENDSDEGNVPPPPSMQNAPEPIGAFESPVGVSLQGSYDDRKTPHVRCQSQALRRALLGDKGSRHRQKCMLFFLNLLINNSVIVDASGSAPGSGQPSAEEVRYIASSPDEEALIFGCKHFDFQMVSRSDFDMHFTILGYPFHVKILAFFEFTSDRKRSSAVVKLPPNLISFIDSGIYTSYKPEDNDQGVYFCFVKGADQVILSLSRPEENKHRIDEALDVFTKDCLRTLCLGYRTLDPDKVEKWYPKLKRASMNQDSKEADRLIAEVEVDLILQGVTGIEDRLATGVPSTIADLMKAGIKIWMLTGDKFETARNIGISTNLVPRHAVHVLILKDRLPVADTPLEDRIADILQVAWRSIGPAQRPTPHDDIERALIAGRPWSKKKQVYVAFFDGELLRTCLSNPELRKLTFSICSLCRSVIFCRVAPQEKGDVVAMVREADPNAVTLAVGDGANDCNMIQRAHVGVGIRGKEGLQAFSTSDYGIAEFRFLRPLLLVHGRWNYRRITKMVLHTFYKNFVFVMPTAYFAGYSLFSGQKVFTEVFSQFYNVALTQLTVLAFGIWDQDVDRRLSLRFPQMYKLGIDDLFFSKKAIAEWVFFGVFHSLIVFFIPKLAFTGISVTSAVDNIPNDFWFVSNVTFLQVLTVVNLKICLETMCPNWMTLATLLASIGIHFFLLFGQSMWPQLFGPTTGSISRMVSQPMVWIISVITPMIALSFDVLAQVFARTFKPETHHLMQFLMRFEQEEAKARRALFLEALRQGGPVLLAGMGIGELPERKHGHFVPKLRRRRRNQLAAGDSVEGDGHGTEESGASGDDIDVALQQHHKQQAALEDGRPAHVGDVVLELLHIKPMFERLRGGFAFTAADSEVATTVFGAASMPEGSVYVNKKPNMS